jgi:hypothetical protein
MAKRKKRAAARKGKTTRKPVKSMRGKPAKRTGAKAKSKKTTIKTKKRAVAKTMAPTVETVVVDVIEEPVPGVMVVSEFEATEIRQPSGDQDMPGEGPVSPSRKI